MSSTFMVTGALGFIGSRLTEQLLDDGYDVIGVDCVTDAYDPAEKLARLEVLREHPHYRHSGADLADAPLDDLLSGVEVVYHLAGRAGVRDSFTSLAKYRHDNVQATQNLLSSVRRAPTVRRLVYASSSSVYGNADLPFDEEGPTNPLSPYGQSKLDAERLCLESNGDCVETLALRYFTVYGPGQRPDMGLRLFAEAAIERRPLKLFGDGTQSRDFTYVDDVVAATRRAADASVSGVAINVGGGSRITLLEVFEILGQLTGEQIRIDHESFARGDAMHTGASLERAQRLLNFRAEVDFARGYAAQVQWLRSRLSNTGSVA
ncbi:MAG: NAD-dependent epimerase/dehydratase family protein [Acidimicrobiaceae bacterium]|nr:NAD-dependent epimerase/dehydratase family protein [Acidimicrobiaceae bacterium]